MASYVPTLTDPDKIGLLIQYREKMDKINDKQLYEHANSSLRLLSTQQLKQFLFVGLNSIKNEISYHQLFQMKSAINQIIEATKIKKLKKESQSKSKSKESVMDKPLIIPIIPKNASLTKIIPFDIISNNICHFLTMTSITNLARADRKLAIICHTPTSINNLMYRYDPYKYTETENDYMIDGYYPSLRKCNLSNIHRLKNIETLSIDLAYINSLQNIRILNLFRKVKYLSFFDMKDRDWYYDNDCNGLIKPMPLLETISFTNIGVLLNILYLLKPYKLNDIDINAAHSYYNQIIYQLKSIAFIDCDFTETLQDLGYDDDEDDVIFSQYKNIVNFILPSQPNNLQVLKLQNTFLSETQHTECKNPNDEFNNIDRIKQSLANLKGFVYENDDYDNYHDVNVFYNLTRNILSNLISFKYLKSLHIHSDQSQTYLNNNNINALNKIIELCISISMNINQSVSTLNTLVPNLEKLCLVINIPDDDKNYTSHFAEIIKSILKYGTKLKLFQIVLVFQDEDNTNKTFCKQKITILTDFTKKFVEALNNIRNYYNDGCKRPLLFKFHIKSSHSKLIPECSVNVSEELKLFANIIQNMAMNYLITYPIGKIQIKYSWNARGHHWLFVKLSDAMTGLERLFRVSVNNAGNLKHLNDDSDNICYNDMDFKQYAISITHKNMADQGIEYENKWKVDCRYCCNTPWV